MRLFLCGGGSGTQILDALDIFSGVLEKEKPILYIPLAMEDKKYDSCYNWFKSEIKTMKLHKFEMVRSSLELSEKDFNNYCALFIGGGNTYKLMYELKQNNNYEKIRTYVENNGVVFGGSAGAIIFGKDIDTCLIEDCNKINLKDTHGFNYLNNVSLLCHLKKKNFNKNFAYLQKYSVNNKAIYLPEEDVIYIHDNKVCLIGNSKYIVFKNGKCFYHKNFNLKKDLGFTNKHYFSKEKRRI